MAFFDRTITEVLTRDNVQIIDSIALKFYNNQQALEISSHALEGK